jgi:RNA polymerase sigma-70 factor (ECF subfamily)
MQTALVSDILRVAKRERVISELDDIETLVRTYRTRLLRFVMFSIGDEDVAASIVQDCFMKAYAGRENFRGDCSVQTWLTSISLNLIRDHQRTKKFQFWKKAGKTAADVIEMADVLPMSGSSPEGQLLAREKAQQVTAMLETLSLNQRTVFLMRFQDKMEIAEIAEAMKMPINTVKTHLHRAVRAVRERMGVSR